MRSGLEQIDVVDISQTILSLSPLVDRAGASDPLGDPRVKAYVEDGRFFLRGADAPYDFITAEPPPPLAAGVASLYSLEYFELVRSRLVPGGIATHWLPVNQLSLGAARAVIRAFCTVFPDCTLWSGAGYDWMLAGTEAAVAPPEEAFARLWADSRTGDDLKELGIERPEQLGALFLADAPQLAEWIAGALPLVDDRPGRLDATAPGPADTAAYRALQEPQACADRFRSSETVLRLWPPALRERTLRLVRVAGRLQPRLRSGRAPGGARRAVGGAREDRRSRRCRCSSSTASRASARRRARGTCRAACTPRSPFTWAPPRSPTATTSRRRASSPRRARRRTRFHSAAAAASARARARRPPRRGARGGRVGPGREPPGSRPAVARVAPAAPRERRRNGCGRRPPQRGAVTARAHFLPNLHGHVHESARLTGAWRDRIGRTLCLSAAHNGPELALVRLDLDDPEGATRELL